LFLPAELSLLVAAAAEIAGEEGREVATEHRGLFYFQHFSLLLSPLTGSESAPFMSAFSFPSTVRVPLADVGGLAAEAEEARKTQSSKSMAAATGDRSLFCVRI
jgi:hypothetical protein